MLLEEIGVKGLSPEGHGVETMSRRDAAHSFRCSVVRHISTPPSPVTAPLPNFRTCPAAFGMTMRSIRDPFPFGAGPISFSSIQLAGRSSAKGAARPGAEHRQRWRWRRGGAAAAALTAAAEAAWAGSRSANGPRHSASSVSSSSELSGSRGRAGFGVAAGARCARLASGRFAGALAFCFFALAPVDAVSVILLLRGSFE